jgi:parallel beta-helix repeat protein
MNIRVSQKLTLGAGIVLLLCTFLFHSVVAQPNGSSFSGIVFIKIDGSIDPSTAPIERNGEMYTLTNSIVGNITIQKDDIKLNGAGFSVQGLEISDKVTIGIDISFRNNVYITNLQVTNFVNGIRLLNSTNCNIFGNVIIDNVDGLRLDNSSNNNVWGNNVTGNHHGIHPFSDNKFYLNNFIENNEHVRFESTEFPNSWDNDYPVGGNYWGNYTGIDQKQGTNQIEDGADNIGDTPQVINSLNLDRYPQMVPYSYQNTEESIFDSLTYILIIGIVVIGLIIGIIFFKKRT